MMIMLGASICFTPATLTSTHALRPAVHVTMDVSTTAPPPLGFDWAAESDSSSHDPNERLLAWLRQMPHAEVGPLALKSSAIGEGTGAFTTRAVAAGELLFTIPPAGRLSAASAGFADELPARARIATNGIDQADTEALVAVLAACWLRGAAEGPHAPYMAVLPMEPSDHATHVVVRPPHLPNISRTSLEHLSMVVEPL